MEAPAVASASATSTTSTKNEPLLASQRTPNNKMFYAHRAHPMRYSPALRSKLAGIGPTTAPLHLNNGVSVSGIKPLTPHNRATSSPHRTEAATAAASSGGTSTSSASSGVSFYTTPNNTLQRQAAMAASRFHMFQAVNNTPPSRTSGAHQAGRIRPVHNPFEAALVERLHLPLICSPSLFHRPATPQHSSTQFEWTIDDVSALNPMNVEAHETQFMSVIDPEQEARAQAAISTYFKEMLTVPSPVDCPLRKQNIASLMPEACKRNKAVPAKPRSRDAVCQTMMTLAPQLSSQLEELLQSFCTYTQDQQQELAAVDGVDAVAPGEYGAAVADDDDEPAIDHDARDASLRRKLFNTSPLSGGGGELSDSDSDRLLLDGVELVNMSPPPGSPQLTQRNFHSQRSSNQHSFRVFKSPEKTATPPTTTNHSRRRRTTGPDDSPSSFGSLSPIACGVASNNSVTSNSRIVRRRSSGGQNASAASTANNRSWRSRHSSSSTSTSTHNNSSLAFGQSTPGTSHNNAQHTTTTTTNSSDDRYRTCVGSLAGKLGGSLDNLTLSSSKCVGRSRSRLSNVSDAAGAFEGPPQCISDDALMMSAESLHNGFPVGRSETSAADETVDENDDVDIDLDGDIDLNGSGNSSCSQHSSTPTRKVLYANRKNLSLSFEDDGFGANDDDDDDDDDDDQNAESDGEFGGLELVVAEGAISDNGVEAESNVLMADLAEEQRDKLEETAAKGLCQTDSGFNDIDV